MRWPTKGPPHLALNPPYFLFVFFGFCFSSLLSFLCFFLIDKKTVFPLKKSTFCLFFSVSLCFSLTFLGLLPFLLFLFLCLSLGLFFLPSFLFFIFSFWFLLFLFVVFAFFVSRCSFVFVVLFVVLCCFES